MADLALLLEFYENLVKSRRFDELFVGCLCQW